MGDASPDTCPIQHVLVTKLGMCCPFRNATDRDWEIATFYVGLQWEFTNSVRVGINMKNVLNLRN